MFTGAAIELLAASSVTLEPAVVAVEAPSSEHAATATATAALSAMIADRRARRDGR
jgi:hypothetical protein